MIELSQRRRVLTESLAFLAEDLVEFLVPLLERVALLVDEASSESERGDEPNGFEGLAARGPLDRLLLSEWLLASEEPDEFVRRFASSELSYLQVDRERPASTARIEVLVDSGPLCMGASRLAFLIVMTVLAQRATELGVPFALGVLGDEPGTYREGELSDLFAGWLKSRRSFLADVEHIEEWLDSGEVDAKRWLLTSQIPNSPLRQSRVVRAEASTWTEHGVSNISIWVDKRSATLPIVDPTSAVRLLRGFGLRKQAVAARDDLHAGAFSLPRFWTRSTRLLLRTTNPDVLLSLQVDATGGVNRGARRHQFSGPVIAAGVIGDRIVGAVIIGDELRIQTLGKSLGRSHHVAVSLSSLPFDPFGELETELQPLLFQSDFFLRARDKWFTIANHDITESNAITVVGSNVNDQPRVAFGIGQTLYVDGRRIDLDESVPTMNDIRLGSLRSTVAVKCVGGWKIVTDTASNVVPVEPDDTMIGVVDLMDGPVLVTLSAAGHVLRLRSHYKVKTLTAFSGWIGDYSLHPTLPLLAVSRGGASGDGVQGDIEVLHLGTEKIVATIRQSDDS